MQNWFLVYFLSHSSLVPFDLREKLRAPLPPQEAMWWDTSAHNTGFSMLSTEALYGLQAFAYSSPLTFPGTTWCPLLPLREEDSDSVIEEQGLSFRSLCGLGSVTSLPHLSPSVTWV